MPLQVAFYKGRSHWIDRLAAWWTRGAYSHCELVAPGANEDGSRMCVSSSPVDGGVRRKRILLDPRKWELVDLPVSDEAAGEAFQWFAERDGLKYDYLGLFGFVWRPYSGSRRRWFCSEALASALGFRDAWRFDPNTLYVVLKRMETAANTAD